ncbi:MAG: DNA mismatch repair endonuclease MutL [bacterium]|nr:DNA mismatch repair endonuclease MutL [bacterium]
MSKIIQLDEHLSNMIAAGEVVERVSSVVKELVENSLDAKSTDITIELTDSGIREIKVTDNGIGMDKTDIKLCYLRHATSKIKNQYDLFRISTLGFRGEALPSIASVSDMTIKSNNGETSNYIHLRASKLMDEGLISLNRGTEITVSNLFFNTPARLKYLKSENTELANVCEIVDKLAISNPSVRFKLVNNKKVLLQTYGNNDMKAIIGNIYGADSIKNMIEVDNEKNGIKIKCYLAQPIVNKSRKSAITLVINGRDVKNYSVINSVIDGYNTYIPVGKYPLAVVFVKMDPMLIDVNVHPTKKEVRLSSEDLLKSLITSTIKNALFKSRLIPELKMKEEKEVFPRSEIKVEEKTPTYIDKMEYIKQSFLEEEQIELEKRLPYLEYIGQYAGTYLLFQNDSGLYLMDQHAAAERVRYEKYIEALSNPTNISQPLMVTTIIDVTKKEKIFVDKNLEEFNKLGVVLEEAGPASYYLRSVPVWIIGDALSIVEEMIKFIVEIESIDLKQIRDELAKRISCKGAIKANKNLSIDEVNTLVKDLSKCKNPFTCPHGRPTIINFSQYEIEKMFLRVI